MQQKAPIPIASIMSPCEDNQRLMHSRRGMLIPILVFVAVRQQQISRAQQYTTRQLIDTAGTLLVHKLSIYQWQDHSTLVCSQNFFFFNVPAS